jgi:hypothetical protein
MICDMLGGKKILKILVKAISKEAIIKRRELILTTVSILEFGADCSQRSNTQQIQTAIDNRKSTWRRNSGCASWSLSDRSAVFEK